MSYKTIFAISAPIEQVPNELQAAQGNVVFQAQYVAMAMVSSIEEALMQAIPLVRDRFQTDNGPQTVTVKENIENEELVSLYFGHASYAPKGLTEIPLVIIQEADFDSIDYITKHFAVPATSVKPDTD